MTFGDFGQPIDPAYAAFREGLATAVKDAPDRWRWRWCPRTEKWFTYSVDRFVLEDLNLPDTPPGSAVRQLPSWPTPEYEVQTIFLPDLWKRLVAVNSKLREQYPSLDLVWSPWGGGDWRRALERAASDPAPTEQWNGSRPSPRALDQIERIKEYVRLGYMSADKGQQAINDVILHDVPDA